MEIIGTLAADTAVEGEHGRYRAQVASRWQMVRPLGGYLAAITLRAAEQESALPFPVSYHCQFLNPARVGPAEVRVVSIQRRESMDTFHVTLSQRNVSIITALVRTGKMRPGPTYDAAQVPRITVSKAADEVDELPELGALPIFRTIGTRLADTDLKLNRIEQPGTVVSSWHRFPDRNFDSPYLDA